MVSFYVASANTLNKCHILQSYKNKGEERRLQLYEKDNESKVKSILKFDFAACQISYHSSAFVLT